MDPHKLNQLADSERAKEAKSRKRKSMSVNERIRFRPSSPESWKVYSRIYPHYYNLFVWFFLVFTLGFVSFFLYFFLVKDDRLLYGGSLLIGIWFLRVATHWLVKVYRFSAFKKWRSNLPYVLKGWEKLGSVENFPSDRYWYSRVEVKVNTKNSLTKEEEKAIKNAQFLLMKNANACFYEPDNGWDTRSKWRNSEDFVIGGSANGSVMGEVYVFLNTYLRGIQNSYGSILSVEVNYKGDLTKVERVQVSSD